MVFLACGILSWLLVPVAMKVAVRRQVFDHPRDYKVQENPVPYLGGVAIVVSFTAVVLLAAAISPPIRGFEELAVILGMACLLALVGLVDDLRGLGPFIRLGVQIAAAVIVLLNTSVSIRLFDGGGPIDSILMVLWIAGITNAFNLLDNMDGLSAGIATIAAAWIGLIAALHGQFLVAALSFAIAGCAVGFLRHNFYPARIYMGDAGSLFLGFVLAVLAIQLRFPAPQEITAFIPLVVLAIPIMDTTLVTITRLLHSRNPLAGGRDHLSHRLVFIGFSVRQAVITIYVLAIFLGWIGLAVSTAEVGTGLMLLSFVAAVLTTFGIILGRVPVYSNSTSRKIMLLEVAKHDGDYAHENQGGQQSSALGATQKSTSSSLSKVAR